MQFDIVGLYRNANMLSICEGTADKMAGDVLRAVFGKTSKRVTAAMDLWMSSLQSGEGRLKKTEWGCWEMVGDGEKDSGLLRKQLRGRWR